MGVIKSIKGMINLTRGNERIQNEYIMNESATSSQKCEFFIFYIYMFDAIQVPRSQKLQSPALFIVTNTKGLYLDTLSIPLLAAYRPFTGCVFNKW